LEIFMGDLLTSELFHGITLQSPSDTEGPLAIGADPQPADGPHTIHYLNGQKHLEGQWQNGQPHGALTTWYESGQIRQEATYQVGLLHGPYRLWHANGQLAVEGHYDLGQKSGVWRKWNPAGALIAELLDSRREVIP
jgi:hypothetical protein